MKRKGHLPRSGAKGPGKLRMLDLRKLSQEYEAAFMRRELADCEKILARILKANSSHVEARLQRARLLGMFCRFSEAHDQFLKAVELAAPDKRADVCLKAAVLSAGLYDPTISLHLFQKALEAGCPMQGRLHYAEHLVRMRRSEDAINQVRAVLDEDPDQPHARLLSAMLETDPDGQRHVLLRQMTKSEAGGRGVAIKAGYELAKELDRLGDYDEAMQTLRATKLLLADEAGRLLPGRRASRKGWKALVSDLDASLVQSWKSQRYKPLNGLERLGLIVGHPRSGTTLLEQIVDSHPQTQSAEEMENFMIMALIPSLGKQTNMLDGGMMEALEGLQPFQIETARKAYRDSIARAMPIAPQTTLLVDKNPSLSNMICPFVRLFPEARIITMIRDPRDVVLSCYFQALLPLNPVSAAYTDLEETALDYAAFMEAYARSAEVLGDSVMELRYEDLVDDVESAARQVTSFLGQPWDSSVLDFHHRAKEKIVRSPTADAVTENVHRRAKARWKHYSRHLEPCMPHLEPFLERWGYA